MMLVWQLGMVIAALVGGISSRSVDKDRDQKGDGRADYIVAFKYGFDTIRSSDDIAKALPSFKIPPKIKYVYSKAISGVGLSGVTREVLDWLEKQDYVLYIEKTVQHTSQASCNVPSSSSVTQDNYKNWGLDRITEATYTSNYAFNPSGNGGSGSVIYIVDSGIRKNHNEFQDSSGTTRVEHFFRYAGSSNHLDCTGHGTMVAGLAGSNTYGVAPNAVIKSVKVGCDGGVNSADLVGGLDAIIVDVDVTNTNYKNKCVINYSYASSTEQSSVTTAVTNATDHGCVFVAAAGNYGSSDYYYPAAQSDAISVGGMNKQNKIACWSNTGSTVDIYAPGGKVNTTSSAGNNKMIKATGTSYAAPLVSGALAILLESSSYTASNVKAQLISQSTKDTLTNEATTDHDRVLYIGT